ncbi:MAG: YcaO-like family protein [Bradymonadales bacterium]|nr:YcaO-like family protein [Bradymonadales bacterium]
MSTPRPILQKPFKAAAPLDTIRRIREILHDLDLFVIEHHRQHLAEGLHSCRLLLGDEQLSLAPLGTNGKGVTARYALASAYAELMERMQNQVFCPPRLQQIATRQAPIHHRAPAQALDELARRGLVQEFLFDPGDSMVTVEELLTRCSTHLARMLGIADIRGTEALLRRLYPEGSVPCTPFLEAASGQVVFVPSELVWLCVTTNGMCAGNTPEEALVHGLSEIFERWFLLVLYRDDLTPPTIPLELFEGTLAYELVQRIEGIDDRVVMVKDCSLGLGLPVVGALILDRAHGKYVFHVGADPCPITALERCLTEIYQGDPKLKNRPLIAGADPFAPTDGQTSSQVRQRQHASTVQAGTGLLPSSLFAPTPSYRFEGFEHPVSRSDREDLAFLLAKLRQLDRDLLVRDCSFLGFPSYQLFVPGMSETDWVFDREGLVARLELLRTVGTLCNLPAAREEAVAQLAEAIEQDVRHVAMQPFSPGDWLPPHGLETLHYLTTELLMVLLYLRTDRPDRAMRWMERYLQSVEEGQDEELRYYRCVYDLLRLRATGVAKPALSETLTLLHGAELADEVLGDCSDPVAAFDQIPFPRCFDCPACEARMTCGYPALLSLLHRLRERHAAHPFDPALLIDLFRQVEELAASQPG